MFQPFHSRWVYVRNPSYFEGDGLVCTQSASSFCRNPFNFVHMLCRWNDDTMPSFNLFQSRWVFVRNPSYFEGDGPVCTRSASSFCCNPLNFCTHAMRVKWWYHVKFQPFQSRWVFLQNHSFFKGDGPVCTRSVSNFWRNPLNFCTHSMWVKWWDHA